MPKIKSAIIACAALLAAIMVSAQAADPATGRQVMDTERAFAASMADRDFEAFKSFLSAETIFFSGETAMRGAERVAEAWEPYFDGPDAPFSWEPKTVEVLDSGSLALSSGPVHDPAGNLVGTFTSIWRLEAPGQWRIIFDKGNPACPQPPEASSESTDP
jgi:ketosteroid isomerase-like protein